MSKILPLNDTLIDAVQMGICRTWNYIASDAMELGVDSNEEAMELVLDADRMYEFDSAGSKLIDQYIAKYGYETVLSFLSRNIVLN